MINPISTSGTPGNTPKAEADFVQTKTAAKAEKAPVRSEEVSLKLETSMKDSVVLSDSAQARNLRQAGQSIPQIALKLGLSIPTVAAFFDEYKY